jgi:hypothetical protein
LEYVHDGVLGAAQSSGGSADFSAAASALAKSKAAAGFELVYILNRMGDGQQANNLGCKSFLILSQEYLGIIMLLFQMQMQSIVNV